MARWTALALTVVACGLSVFGVIRWQQVQPPDPGAISVAAITPPSTEWWMAEPEPWCDKAVPGLTARGSSQLSEAQLRDWYDREFGPVVEEPTARKNQRGDPAGPWRVYGEISVMIVGSGVTVYTYDTVSHDCLNRDTDRWDLRNAFSYRGLCVETNLIFWGVGYGKAEPEEPPADWTVLTFDEGRRIAHGISDVSVVYAQEFDGEPWHRYDAFTECFLD